MADWTTFAKNNVPSRDWSLIRQAWSAAAIGFEYGTVPALEDSVSGIVGQDFEALQPSTVISMSGREVSALHDTAESALRGVYILAITKTCLAAGQPSWASLDAYHCSLVFCRAILGLLGIYFVRIGDTNCAVDIFPEGGDASLQRKFHRQFRDIEHPIRLFYRKKGSLIEQAGMWALLVRTLRMASLPTSLDQEKAAILSIKDGFGRARNDILYTNHEWPFSPDLLHPVTFLNLRDDLTELTDVKTLFSEKRDGNFALCRTMVNLAIGLINDVGLDAESILASSPYGEQALTFRSFNRDRV
jgi:hypothetical protein